MGRRDIYALRGNDRFLTAIHQTVPHVAERFPKNFIMKKTICLLTILGLVAATGACSKSGAAAQPEERTETPGPPKPWAPTTEIFTRQGSPYSFKLINKSQHLTESRKKAMIDHFFKVYPIMVEFLNPNALKQLVVTLDPDMDGIAHAINGEIFINAAWFMEKPEHIDVITHEGTHIVQDYKKSALFLQEGIPDFLRHKTGLPNVESTWNIGPYSQSHSLASGYTPASRFLVWLDDRIEKGIVLDADKACRAGTYTPKFWWTRTGRSVDELWDLYAANPALDGPVIALPVYTPVPGGAIADGVYSIISAFSQLAVDVPSAKVDDDVKLIQWNFERNANQFWQFIHVGEGWYRIHTGHSGKVAEAPAQPGSGIAQATRKNLDSQLWKPVKNADNTWQLVNKLTGLCWEISGSQGGAALLQQAWAGKQNQKWQLVAE